MTEIVRSDELDVNGIPKLVRNISGVSKNNSDNVSGSVTNMFGITQINAIVNFIKAPGAMFGLDETYAIAPGIILMGILGTVLAGIFITVGIN